MKIYPIRYSPEAVNDLDTVWDDVYEASKNYDIADKYVDDLMDRIKKVVCLLGTFKLEDIYIYVNF